ncbi:MAG: hypothetical protein HFJ28_01965 [Clostridia bacterium]|nr:hypothetical protein [Clostridia bacterium]
MKKWILSLPKITREVSKTDTIIFNNSYIELKNDLLKPDMNNNEFLFQKIGQSFKEENYEQLTKDITSFKNVYDNYLTLYIDEIVYNFKEKFEHNSKSNLNILLSNWNKEINPQVKETVMRLEVKNIFDYINNLNTYNDREIIENISNIVVGRYIEDWKEDTYDEFFEKLTDIFDEIKQIEKADLGEQEKIIISDGKEEIQKYINTSEISLIGNTLKNNIEDSIEEYADAISESEKIKILLQIIKKYM